MGAAALQQGNPLLAGSSRSSSLSWNAISWNNGKPAFFTKWTVVGVAVTAVVLLLSLAAPATRLGAPPHHSSNNMTDLYLREQGPLYLHASQRCRAPAGPESIPQLQLVATWQAHSSGGAQAQVQGVTLATQLSLDRLAELEMQCRSWPHTLAAAVYVPIVNGAVFSQETPQHNGISLQEARGLLGRLHMQLAQGGACTLRLRLFAEVCADNAAAGLFPFNAMRNRALQMVDTEAVLLLDTDVLVSRDFGEEVGSRKGWAALRRQLDATPAVLLPAFQPSTLETSSSLGSNGNGGSGGGGGRKESRSTNREGLEDSGSSSGGGSDGGSGEDGSGGEENQQGDGGIEGLAWRAVDGGKEWVVGQYQSGTLLEFPVPQLRQGGNCTRYNSWAEASSFLGTHYSFGCEPYVVMLREHMPWFDERFRGYGFDKVVEHVVMSQWGVTYSVHPRGYLVHVPHQMPKTLGTTRRLKHGSKLQQLLGEVRLDLQKHRYYPVTAFEQSCLLRPVRQARRRNRIQMRPA